MPRVSGDRPQQLLQHGKRSSLATTSGLGAIAATENNLNLHLAIQHLCNPNPRADSSRNQLQILRPALMAGPTFFVRK